jgi:hypothetical protein
MKNFVLFLILILGLNLSICPVYSQMITKWGLVYGSDTDIIDADREAQRFNNPQKNPPLSNKYKSRAVILSRKGNFRSVLLFKTEEEAKQALSSVENYLTDIDKQTMKAPSNWERGSFVVNLSVWCPKWYTNASIVKKIKVYKCQ